MVLVRTYDLLSGKIEAKCGREGCPLKFGPSKVVTFDEKLSFFCSNSLTEQNNPLNSIALLYKPHQLDHFQERNFFGFRNFSKKKWSKRSENPNFQKGSKPFLNMIGHERTNVWPFRKHSSIHTTSVIAHKEVGF